MNLPTVLIIDDLLGTAENHLEREAFCLVNGILPIPDEIGAHSGSRYLAVAKFLSGQKTAGDSVENDLEGTIRGIKNGWNENQRWSLVLLDLHFKTGEISTTGSVKGRKADRSPDSYFGLALLKAISKDPSLMDLPIILLSSMERTQIEEQLASLGALGFIEKEDLDAKKMANLLDLYGLLGDEKVVGRSLACLKSLRDARGKSRIGNKNILITGESGTGKEIFGRYIYANSLRFGREEKFNTVFLSGVPESLADDLIFGHEKGAFFGAYDDRPGMAEVANKGIIFFDEIGDIPAAVQSKLLRLLDENIRETRRIGGRASIKVDIMALLATERIDILLDEKLFRMSLLSRLNFGSRIHLPPLRERGGDVLLLAKYFMEKHGAIKELSSGAIQWLEAYHWPRNVRELELLMSEVLQMTRDLNVITEMQFDLAKRDKHPPGVVRSPSTQMSGDSPASQPPQDISLDNLIHIISQYEFQAVPSGQLEGMLPTIRVAVARLLTNYLKISFGLKGQLTGAVRFMQGDPHVNTVRAASTVLDIVELADEGQRDLLLGDETLNNIVEKALRVRMRKSFGRGSQQSNNRPRIKNKNKKR